MSTVGGGVYWRRHYGATRWTIPKRAGAADGSLRMKSVERHGACKPVSRAPTLLSSTFTVAPYVLRYSFTV